MWATTPPCFTASPSTSWQARAASCTAQRGGSTWMGPTMSLMLATATPRCPSNLIFPDPKGHCLARMFEAGDFIQQKLQSNFRSEGFVRGGGGEGCLDQAIHASNLFVSSTGLTDLWTLRRFYVGRRWTQPLGCVSSSERARARSHQRRRFHPAYLTGRAVKRTWGNLRRQKGKEMTSKKIASDVSELVPTTTDVNITLNLWLDDQCWTLHWNLSTIPPYKRWG
jgi:hypothetical protein